MKPIRHSGLTKYVLFVLLLLLATPAAHAQELWGGTRHGMTLQEVKALHSKGVTSSELPLATGASPLWVVSGIAIVDETFSATFYFKSGLLDQVTLRIERPRPLALLAIVESALTEALRAKYGQEISREVTGDISILRTTSATWMSGTTNISLLMMGSGRSDALLNVSYQVRVSKSAENL